MFSPAWLPIVAWFSAGVDAAAGVSNLVVNARRRRKSGAGAAPRLWQIALAGAIALVSFIAKAFVFGIFGQIGPFGLIHLAYVALALVPPCLGLTILWLGFRKPVRRIAIHILLVAAVMLAPAPLCAYASFVAPYQLVVERCDVPLAELQGADEPIRIGVLADLQTDRVTSYEHDAVDRLLAERTDLIVLPGDFFQGPETLFRRQLPTLRDLLAKLEAPFGVYACLGNVDPPRRTAELLAGTPVHLLHNDIEVIEIRGRRIALGGVELNYRSAEARRVVRRLGEIDADVRLLLAHMPDAALDVMSDDGIDLIVAGHTHGGQVVIPGLGPPITLSMVPRDVAAGGLHHVGEQLIYVSRGVGFERGLAPPMRFCCPPELSVLTLPATP